MTEVTHSPVVIARDINTDETYYQYCNLPAGGRYFFEIKSIIGTQKSTSRRSEAFETFQYG